jgi:hypothetical protein
MSTETLDGQWFLPKNEVKLSGRLDIDYGNGKIELILYGNQYIEGTMIKLSNPNNRHEYFHDLIVGETTFDSLTIVNCTWSETKTIGKDLFEIHYRGSILLFGVHLTKRDDLKIDKAIVKFPYLASWYDGDDSLFKVDGFEKEIHGAITASVDVTNDLKLNFVDQYYKNTIRMGVSYEVSFEKRIEFQYSGFVDFDRLISDASKFAKLLEFTLNRKVEYQVHSLSVPKELLTGIQIGELEGHSSYVHISFFKSFSKRELIEKYDINQTSMIISAWVLQKDRLNALIKKWYSNLDYYHIYDYYLDSNNWFEGTDAVLSSVMFNNRFLNLIQALESYQKKTDTSYQNDIQAFNDAKDKVVDLLSSKPELLLWLDDSIKAPENLSLRQRLESLLIRLQPIIESLIGPNSLFDNFPGDAKKYRHKLSHGDLRGIDLGQPLVLLFHQAQFLLLLLVLKSLDFTDDEMVGILKDNQSCIRKVNEIIRRKRELKKSIDEKTGT